jgi:tetratricopeptide (TPR) repeat protein
MATPAGVAALLKAALQHHKDGRLKQAAREYKRVLQAKPDQPDALNLLGVIELSQGRSTHARDLILKALKNNPEEASFHCNLGNALAAMGLMPEAQEAYARSLQLAPEFALAHFNLGLLYARTGQESEALDAFQAAVRHDRSMWQGQLELARIAESMGKMDVAERAFALALAQQPHSAAIKGQFAEFLARGNRFDEALELLYALLNQDTASQSGRLALALTCYRAGRYDEARDAYRQALARDDGLVAAWNGLGRVLRTVGELGEARACFERSVTIDPTFADGHRNLALLEGIPDAKQRHAVKRLLARTDVRGEDRVLAGFAMGKILDAAGEYAAAFAAYREANTLALDAHAAAGRSFSPEIFSGFIDKLIATEPQPGRWCSQSQIPVFVLGAPRSGTSLVEQIASTHPAVHGSGELRTIATIADLRHNGSTEHLQRAVNAYLVELIGAKDGAIRGIDKMPDNIFHISTILSIFPNARIIWCTRDPLDNLVSCYFQHFTSGNVFSYDLEHCAHRLKETGRLQEHWAMNAPSNILKVTYETLVQDFDIEARRIIAFLGLPWDARCLVFHETVRPVATASGWQVRQPLYQSAVGRWRCYEAYLEAARNILEMA